MQKQPKILNYKNLMLEKYEYLQPHKTSNGTYQTICNYRLSRNELIPFYFETPKLKTTSGIVRINNNYYIDFELQQSGEGGLFYQYLLKNDEHNITTCYQNSKDWFNQVMPLHIVENYYKTPILLRSSGQLPVVRVRLPSHKGNILTEIFNVRKEKVNDVSCIQEGDLIVGILEFSGLNFMSQNFAPCYELQKIKIFKDNDFRAIPSGYIFSDTNDKVDIVDTYNEKMISNDKIMEQPIEIEKKISIEDMSSRVDMYSKLEDKPKSKSKSFFDIIKETTFKHFLSDDELFMNNNKTITDKKNKKLEKQNMVNNILEQNTKELKVEPIIFETVKPIETIDLNKNSDIGLNVNSNVNSTMDLKIGIQDVKAIDLNIDYELDSPNESSSPTQEGYDNNLENYENGDNISDENGDNISDENGDNNSDENIFDNKGARGAEALADDDDGIDFETLNDLEVIVFDE